MVLKRFLRDTDGTLLTGLRAFYKGDDLTEFFVGGGTYDLSGTGTPTFGAGKVGNALTLNGSTQYASAPSGMMPHQQNMTFGFFFKINSTSGAYYLGGETGGGNNMYLDWNNNAANKLRWNKLTGGVNYTADYAWSADTSAHLLILSHDSVNGMQMFLDDPTSAVATNANTNAPASPSAVFEFGSFSGLNSPLAGYIDQIFVYTKTLSLNERLDMWNGGNGNDMVNIVVPPPPHIRQAVNRASTY